MPPDASPETTCCMKSAKAAKGISVPQVAAPHRLVVAQRGARPRERDPADLEHVRVGGHGERDARVLLDDEHGQPFLLVELADDAEELAHDERREPERGLV